MAKRRRATAVAIRNKRVLLVRDKGKEKYSLPGGGIHKGEPSISAAARELFEETGVNCSKIEWQFPYEGKIQQHQVFRVTPQGDPKIKDGELNDFVWWDGKWKLSVDNHVTQILKRMRWPR